MQKQWNQSPNLGRFRKLRVDVIKMKILTSIMLLGLIACGQCTTRSDSKTTLDTFQSKSSSHPDKVNVIENSKLYDSSIYQSYINAQLKAYLGKAFPGWTLPALNRWDTLWFNQYMTDSSLANYVSGDFNCDSKKDYGLIIEDNKGIIVAYAFLSTRSSFQAFKLEEFGKDNGEQIEIGLEVLKPGEYNYIDPDSDNNPPPVKIKCEAVQVIGFEKSAETYYWDKGKLKSIMTGD